MVTVVIPEITIKIEISCIKIVWNTSYTDVAFLSNVNTVMSNLHTFYTPA